MTKMKRVYVHKEDDTAYPDLLNGNFKEVLQELLRMRSMIPREYRNSAEIEVRSCSAAHDGSQIEIEISYVRPETPDEEFIRVRQENARKDAEMARKREQLAKLKQELGEEPSASPFK